MPKSFVYCMYVCMYVYTLFVSRVNDGFETGIKSDIEFEWMKLDAEKEGKKTTLWNLLCSNNNYFRSLKLHFLKN
jgi:hypothetical protein